VDTVALGTLAQAPSSADNDAIAIHTRVFLSIDFTCFVLPVSASPNIMTTKP